MQRLLCLSVYLLAFSAASFPLGAQVPPASLPGLRLTHAQLAQAVKQIDDAVIAYERERWEVQNRDESPARRKPFTLPAPVDDATFLRRVTLDLHARNPDATAVRAYLADKDVMKHSRLIDRLLLDPASGARRFTRLANMLRVKDAVLGVSLKSYVGWLQDACANSKPYDALVRELITASGDLKTNPATGWILGDEGRGATTMAEALRIFVDENMHCARCHDHPLSHRTQMELYQFAACLGGTQVVRTGPQGSKRLWPSDLRQGDAGDPLVAGETLSVADVPKAVPLILPPAYRYKDGKAGDIVRPSAWLWKGDEVGAMKNMNLRPDRLRGEFATWLTGSQRFAEVAALRTWVHLFGWAGRGQYGDPESFSDADDSSLLAAHANLRSCSNEGSRNLPDGMTAQFLGRDAGHAGRDLLRTLGRALAAVRYDTRELERIICHTAAYHREGLALTLGAPLRPAAPLVRRLPAETIWNNLVLVQSDGAIPGVAPLSHELVQVPDPDHPSRVFGRGARLWGDNSLPIITHRMVRLMMNGESVQIASDPESPLVKRLRRMQQPEAAVDEAFLAVLARFPSQAEKQKTMDHVVAHPATGWEDVVWSLLNTSEFLFQW
jgi:hypothetical protein